MRNVPKPFPVRFSFGLNTAAQLMSKAPALCTASHFLLYLDTEGKMLLSSRKQVSLLGLLLEWKKQKKKKTPATLFWFILPIDVCVSCSVATFQMVLANTDVTAVS